MPEIIVSTLDGQTQALAYTVGSTAMEVIRDAGIDELTALCGGVLSCATCHVYVDPQFASQLPAMGEDEAMLLGSAERRVERSRLSCQIRLTDAMSGIRMTIAEQE